MMFWFGLIRFCRDEKLFASALSCHMLSALQQISISKGLQEVDNMNHTDNESFISLYVRHLGKGQGAVCNLT